MWIKYIMLIIKRVCKYSLIYKKIVDKIYILVMFVIICIVYCFYNKFIF